MVAIRSCQADLTAPLMGCLLTLWGVVAFDQLLQVLASG